MTVSWQLQPRISRNPRWDSQAEDYEDDDDSSQVSPVRHIPADLDDHESYLLDDMFDMGDSEPEQ